MEGRENVVTMREVTKEQDSPMEQGDTKEETREEKNILGKQVGIGQSPCKKERRRSRDIILLR